MSKELELSEGSDETSVDIEEGGIRFYQCDPDGWNRIYITHEQMKKVIEFYQQHKPQ